MTWLRRSWILVLVSAMMAAPASAFAHDDDDDDDRKRSRHYRNKVGRELAPGMYCPCAATNPAPRPVARTPQPFPKETANDHASARERQVELLERELAAEQDHLAKAKSVQDQEAIELHRKNIAALRRELATAYR